MKDSSPFFSPFVHAPDKQRREEGKEQSFFWRRERARVVEKVERKANQICWLCSGPSLPHHALQQAGMHPLHPLSPSDDATLAMKLNFHVSPRMRSPPFHLFRRGWCWIGRVRCPSFRPVLRCCLSERDQPAPKLPILSKWRCSMPVK